MHDQKELNKILKTMAYNLYKSGLILPQLEFVNEIGALGCSTNRINLYNEAKDYMNTHFHVSVDFDGLSEMYYNIVIDDEEKFTIAKLTWG